MNRAKRIAAILVLLIIGAGLVWTGLLEFLNTRKLADEGISTTGQIVDYRERTGRKGRHYYYLTIQFQTAADQSVRKQLRVNTQVFQDAVAAGSVKVHYLADKPEVCRVGDQVKIRFGNLLMGVLILGGGIGWAFLCQRCRV